MWQKTNILNPDDRYIKVLAFTPVTDISLFHRSFLATKQSLLYFPERSTSFDKINSFNTRGEALEVSECLFDNKSSGQFTDCSIPILQG
jgi:hypothetical protein